MNIPIKNLMTKLTRQLDSLQKQMLAIHEEIRKHQQDMQKLQNLIEEACEVPLTINPEQEMSRLSFTLQKQDACERLELLCNDGKGELKRLEEREIRLKTELKLLERHKANMNEEQRVEEVKKEMLAMDEWALRRKK